MCPELFRKGSFPVSSFFSLSATPTSLHWLPVRFRIMFKICTMTHEALSSKQLSYLLSTLKRLSSSNLLAVPRVTTNAGTRAFSVAAPTLWNTLHDNIKSAEHVITFRRYLKTYLLDVA